MYHRLIYASRAAVHPIDLDDILYGSQQRNVAFDVTGGLAIVDDVFLQYLEGEEGAVEWLFERISQDTRHKDLKVLERRTVPRLTFGTWSMALLDWNDDTKMIFRSFSPGRALDLYETDPSTAAPLFHAWARTAHWGAGQSRVRYEPPVRPPE